jgi:hypothetical protein
MRKYPASIVSPKLIKGLEKQFFRSRCDIYAVATATDWGGAPREVSTLLADHDDLSCRVDNARDVKTPQQIDLQGFSSVVFTHIISLCGIYKAIDNSHYCIVRDANLNIKYTIEAAVSGEINTMLLCTLAPIAAG